MMGLMQSAVRSAACARAEHLLIWNELMIREHRLHDARLVGRQFRCLIGSDHGWLGGIGFGSAARYLEDRDEWMGWNAAQRTAHLPRVINTTRFLVRPDVRCPILASHVLGLCARRIAGDLERRCKLRPWLLESFVDLTAYLGTWYKEANWRKAGQTKGRGRNGPRDAGLSRKDIYWHPLMGGLDARCGVECFAAEALESHHGLDGAGWAEQEFGTCALGDKRLTRRLVKIVGDEAAHPGGPHAQAAGGDPAQLKAFYRFVNNENPEMNVTGLLQTHRTQSLRRMKARDTVLVVQDTTDLNFTSYTHCAGLGETNANQTGAKADLLVRAKWDRQLEGTDATLFAELAAAPLAKSVKIAVPRQREHVGKPSAPGRPLIWVLSAPLVSAVENAISLFLLRQVVAVDFFVFNVLGYPPVQQGNVLILPRGQVGVADACSGIRSLTACLFAGSFLAAIFLDRLWKKVLLVGVAMALAFFTNLLRSLFLTAWAYAYGSEAIEGTLHDATGFAILGLTCVGLFCLLPLFNAANWRRWLG